MKARETTMMLKRREFLSSSLAAAGAYRSQRPLHAQCGEGEPAAPPKKGLFTEA
jgi:hypothetical protein